MCVAPGCLTTAAGRTGTMNGESAGQCNKKAPQQDSNLRTRLRRGFANNALTGADVAKP